MKENQEFYTELGKKHLQYMNYIPTHEILILIIMLIVCPPTFRKFVFIFFTVGFCWRLCWWKFRHNTKISFDYNKRFLVINKRPFHFSDIEQYWTAKRFSRYFAERYLPIQTTMLYIKVKNKFFPYYFDLDRNFSSQDSKEILHCLKRMKIKNKKGNSQEFYLFLLIVISILIFLAIVFLFYRIL